MDLLRISTAGSVDDGKSTLIGRLLYDNNALTTEQQQLVEAKTKEKNLQDLDFSVITDGLIAEREQGITIDVAHIYFSSGRRKFIIADSPGHVEYTRNMVTGASNAEISIILIDARKGLLEQSYRHFYISQLLQLHTVVFCVNKIDLVDYSEARFQDIEKQIHAFVGSQNHFLPTIHVIPISSLKGDNVVHKSPKTPWYKGQTLNEILHDIKPYGLEKVSCFRMDIQDVIHVQNHEFKDYRGYLGRIASGDLKVGDTVLVLPSKKTAIITEIRRYKDTLQEASQGMSVNISLDRDIDISRGYMFVKPDNVPADSKAVHATVVWLEDSHSDFGAKYLIQAGSRTTQAKLKNIAYIIPPEHPSQKVPAEVLNLNDIAKVELQLAQPLFLDTYSENKHNGAFILINPITNNTCAVGFAE